MDERIYQLLEQIKSNYVFQSDKQLEELLSSLADGQFKGVTYWDYVQVETLLSLSRPKTDYPDEHIFIRYHQICELYFRLIIQELEKITDPEKSENSELTDFNKNDEFYEVERWNESLKRISRYWRKLIFSFDILKDGMYKNEFRKFRLALMPASGFQTYQFRLIEIMLTSVENLIKVDERNNLPRPVTIENGFDKIYWRSGAMYKNEENGNEVNKPAKVLNNFNKKYDVLFREKLNYFDKKNLNELYINADDNFKNKVKSSIEELERNILLWKVAHYRAVLPYLVEGNHEAGEHGDRGTGGTDWKNYLPIVKQKIIYFPGLWDDVDLTSDVAFQNKINQFIAEFYEDFKKDSSNIFPEIKRIIHKESHPDV